MENPILPTFNLMTLINTLETKCQKINPKGPVTPSENKVKDDDDVKYILRLKKILEKTGEESQSESVLFELLMKVRIFMNLTVETLEATMIGKTVSALKKHAYEKIRKFAAVVKQWNIKTFKERKKKVVDMMMNMEIRDKVEANSFEKLVETTKSLQLKLTNVKNMKTANKVELGKSRRASKIGKGRVNKMDSFGKTVTTKRSWWNKNKNKNKGLISRN